MLAGYYYCHQSCCHHSYIHSSITTRSKHTIMLIPGTFITLLGNGDSRCLGYKFVILSPLCDCIVWGGPRLDAVFNGRHHVLQLGPNPNWAFVAPHRAFDPLKISFAALSFMTAGVPSFDDYENVSCESKPKLSVSIDRSIRPGLKESGKEGVAPPTNSNRTALQRPR